MNAMSWGCTEWSILIRATGDIEIIGDPPKEQIEIAKKNRGSENKDQPITYFANIEAWQAAEEFNEYMKIMQDEIWANLFYNNV